jgi:hypothetical protein
MPGGPPAEEARRETRARAVSVAISSSLSGLVWVMVLIAVCGIVGLDLGPVIASAGLAGVALAFGAQSLVQDLLGGLFILLEDHFGIGDEVDLGDAVGVVERISLRETVLRGLDGTVWHVRNGEIERVGNHSQVWSAAVIDVEVVHGTDVPAASALMAGAAAAVAATAPWRDQVIGPPQVLGVQALSGDGLTLRLLMRTLAGSHFAVERALRERVAVAFSEAGVEFAARRLSGQIHRRSACGRDLARTGRGRRRRRRARWGPDQTGGDTMPETSPSTGPVEWVALTFPGTVLDPAVARPIADLSAAGTVHVLDAVVVHKAPDGTVTEGELEDEGAGAFDGIEGEVLELLSHADLLGIAERLEPDSTTLVLVWENRWATGFTDAVRRQGGRVLAHDRVPPEDVESAMRAAASSAASSGAQEGAPA